MKRVVITGPTGTIGMALIKKCIEKKIQVLAIVNPNSVRKEQVLRHPQVKCIECDISGYLSLKWEEQYDAWFHLAWCGASGTARNDMYLQNDNVKYLLDAVKAAKKAGCGTFGGAGSQAEYGASGLPLNGNSPAFPDTGYGMAKLCAGQMGRMFCKENNIRFIWPRIFSVYGPYDGENTMIMTGIRKLLDGEVPSFTKGEQEWDYLYCDDAAEILLRLAQKGVNGKVYCIGSGKTRKLSEYIEVMRDEIDPKAEIDLGGVPYGNKQLMYLCADMRDVKADTGFDKFTSFEEGISKTIDWCRAQRKENV